MCEILVCDRCSAFVYDRKNNELWSPSGTASKVYRLSDQHGLAGHVARTAETLNIKDVYKDDRFDSAYDIKTGYRTKTILAVPIRDKEHQVLGVLEAINRLPRPDGRDNHFSLEDEGILNMLAQILTDILENSLLHDDREAFYQDLLKVLEIGSKLNSEKHILSLIKQAEEQMCTLFNVRFLRVLILNGQGTAVKFLDENHRRFIHRKSNFGLVGKVIEEGKTFMVHCASNHPDYNGTHDMIRYG